MWRFYRDRAVYIGSAGCV